MLVLQLDLFTRTSISHQARDYHEVRLRALPSKFTSARAPRSQAMKVIQPLIARSITLQSSIGSKSAFVAPQSGQTQVSGMASNAVPAAMPPSGSPTAGSYT